MSLVVGELLRTTTAWFRSRGIDSARLDAELLLGEVLDLPRLQLYTSFDRPVSPGELDAFRALVKRRGNREPVAYILGRCEFYGRRFSVDSRVLIPRPDTETLVDAALALPEQPGVVLDYGTGSGCIALTLAAERSGWKLLAVDVSPDALEVARANADALQLGERVGFVVSDGFARVPRRFQGELAAIVANPPYIPEADRAGLMADVRDHEPAGALFAGDGLVHYRRLAREGRAWLRPGGWLLVEVGHQQAQTVTELLAQAGWSELQRKQDLGRIDRVLLARNPGGPATMAGATASPAAAPAPDSPPTGPSTRSPHPAAPSREAGEHTPRFVPDKRTAAYDPSQELTYEPDPPATQGDSESG